jgi:hypothetical protein
MVTLTKNDVKLIMSCWKSGKITFKDLQKHYKTASAIKDTIIQLKALGIIREEKCHFIIDRGRFSEVQERFLFKEPTPIKI